MKKVFFARIVDQSSKLQDSVCLRFVDPYGDTVFNQKQIPVLVEELQRVRPQLAEPGTVNHLDQVVALAKKSIREVHTYLRFYGD
jgi:hypothetical protein